MKKSERSSNSCAACWPWAKHTWPVMNRTEAATTLTKRRAMAQECQLERKNQSLRI